MEPIALSLLFTYSSACWKSTVMDQESLTQIKQIVTEATDATEGRLRGEIRQIVMEATQAVEARLRGDIQQTAGRLREDIQQIEHQLRGEIEDAKRHTGVLVEHLGHAEGHQSLHHKIEEVRSELRSDIRQESEDTRALLRSPTSYQPSAIGLQLLNLNSNPGCQLSTF